MIKRLLVTCLLVFGFTITLFANGNSTPQKTINYENESIMEDPPILRDPVVKQDVISLYYADELMGTMTIKEYSNILEGAEFTLDMVMAEDAGNVRVLINGSEKSILKLKQGKSLEVKLTFQWFKIESNGDEVVFKELVVTQTIKAEKDKESIVYKIYRDIASVGFPLTLLILMIILI